MIISPVGFWLRRWLLPCVALAFLLLAAGSAQATITVLNYWHLGENDPGAVSGGQCTITTDTGGHTLTNTPVAGPHPIYTNGVSLAVSAETASVLAVAFTNNEYLAGNVATAAVDNFGIECWVNTGTNAGAHMVVNNGLRNNGWGLYQSGTTYEAIYGGRTFFGSAAAPMNTWVHLALVRNNGVAILYTNGVPASTNSVTAPIMPSDSFTVGGDANFPEYFVGGIDEVRVFTFASGAFSTNDLLLNATHLLVVNTNDAGPGSLRNAIAYAPSGATVNFTNTLSGQTILLTSGALAVNQSVTIDASALADGIQLNGNASSPVLLIQSGTVHLSSLTITNGNDISGSYAGGIASITTLTLDNCTIAGNLEPNSGGGIYNAGTLTLNNCTLANNDGGGGSGGGIDNSGTLMLNNSTVVYNRTSGDGGGIYSPGTLNLTNSIVCGNTAPSDPDIGGPYSGAGNLVGLNAQLAPLGNYGGPTPTMPPYAGSPAIDAGSDTVNSFLTTDQRGHARQSGAHVDIGAVEVDTNSIVTLNTDTSAAGTLRYAVAHAQTNDLVSFAQNLSGATILLSGSAITLNQGVTIDASSLANGIQINGNASSPVLVVHAGTVLLNSLTITNASNGGIENTATLTLDDCTITGNVCPAGGGGIYNDGTLTINNCTVANNSAGGGEDDLGETFGGGIDNSATLTMNNCTVANNVCSNIGFASGSFGGGICNGYTLTLNNCTVANNTSGSGGGIDNSGTLMLNNSIICSNTAASSPDMRGTYSAANTLVGVNALLAPLGNYGGPTQTMPPEPGSPALGAGNPAVTNFLATDQRGLPRAIGGNVDIGAVELQSGEAHSIVLNTNDAGPGSLRQTIANAATTATVTFAPSLSGQVILLSSGQIALGNSGLVIDGSALSGGVQINGTASSRHFTVNSGASVVLNALTLTNGLATTGNAGGAVNNNGTLTVNNCTLAGNSSTVSGVGGGAIHNGGTLNVNNSTLAQNHSAFFGGAIANANSMTVKVNNSTIVSNTATAGGGIYNNGGFLDVTNSIVAGNTPLGGDIVNSATFNQASNLYNTASAQVSPLGNYGGPTQTMPPKPGSPAIDGGTATATTTDQRGYPRLSGAHVDIGAVEVQFASAPFRLGSLSRLGNGTVQLSFTNLMGGNFTAFATTNLTQPFNTWSNLGPVTESPIGSGVFQFTDPQASKYPQRFYSVTSP